MILNYNKIELELESNKRWCNIFGLYIYNYCITCRTEKQLIYLQIKKLIK